MILRTIGAEPFEDVIKEKNWMVVHFDMTKNGPDIPKETPQVHISALRLFSENAKFLFWVMWLLETIPATVGCNVDRSPVHHWPTQRQ